MLALKTRAAELGLAGVPADIQLNLDDWSFITIEAQVAEAMKALDAYVALRTLVDGLQLPVTDAVARSWGTATVRQTARLIANQRQAASALDTAFKDFAREDPSSPAQRKLADARAAYEAGEFSRSEELVAAATTTKFNAGAADKIIEAAKARQTAYKGGFLERVGLLFANPDADLARAEEALANGDPDAAMKYATSAFEGWDNARQEGLKYLMVVVGITAVIVLAGYWLLARSGRPSRVAKTKAAVGGHSIADGAERRGSWSDWENSS